MTDHICVQQQAFDSGAEISRLTHANHAMGALVSFVGMMRDINEGEVVSEMMLEHYPGMTENALKDIVARARERWQLGDVTVIHRVGRLLPANEIVLVAVTGAHRGEAFDACEYIIDYLKTDAPFWKKEHTAQGDRWVEQRQNDLAAKDAWHKQE